MAPPSKNAEFPPANTKRAEADPLIERPASNEPAADSASGDLYPKVRVETTKGSFVIELNAAAAPITVLNFLQYVEDGFYNGTIFHRVLSNAMVQAGGYTPDMEEKKEGVRPPIKSEWGNGLTNRQGSVGMVRQPGFAHSATTQFYINLVDNYELEVPNDGAGYTVFGRVGEGGGAIQAISAAELGTHPKYAAGKSAVVPKEPIIIKSIRVISPLNRVEAEKLAKLSAMNESELLDALIAKYEKDAGRKAVRTESGLAYVDLKIGSGASPTLNDAVEVLYRGLLLNNREFEESGDEAKTFEMSGVIKGWQEGLQSMQERGRRVLFIPPALGFGSSGVPGKIPGDSTIVFDIELLVVKPVKPAPLIRFPGEKPD